MTLRSGQHQDRPNRDGPRREARVDNAPEAPTKTVAEPASIRASSVQVLPTLWMLTLVLGLLLRVSLWGVAALSVLWGAVMLYQRLRGMAIVAIVAGLLLALFLFASTVGID